MRVFLELGVALCLLGVAGCGDKNHGGASADGTQDGSTDAPLDGTTDAPIDGGQDGGTDAPADGGCVCPSSSADPIAVPLACYCALVGPCEADGGLPVLCVDNDAVESIFAGCNMRRVQYTNGGGLEQVSNFYNATTGEWIGSRHQIDGPDFCGHNVAVTGTSQVDAGCALTSERSLCGDGGSGDGGSGDGASDASDAGAD
jgi:hypothetical protein